MKKFEYKVEKHPIETDEIQLTADLNDKGNDGWELASVNQSGFNFVYIFKREQQKVKKSNGKTDINTKA